MEIIAGHQYQPLVSFGVAEYCIQKGLYRARKVTFFIKGSRVRPWRWVLKAGSFLVTTSVVKSAWPCWASVSVFRMEPEEALDWNAWNYL